MKTASFPSNNQRETEHCSVPSLFAYVLYEKTSKDWSKTWSLTAAYKVIPGTVGLNGGKAMAVGKSKESEGLGKGKPQPGNRAGDFCQLCRQGIPHHAYCRSKMGILII